MQIQAKIMQLIQNKCNIYAYPSNNHVKQTKQMQHKCNTYANTNNNHLNHAKQNAKQMQHICEYKQ